MFVSSALQTPLSGPGEANVYRKGLVRVLLDLILWCPTLRAESTLLTPNRTRINLFPKEVRFVVGSTQIDLCSQI